MADNIDEELHSMVKGIVDELEAAVAGNLYKRDDGEFEVIEDLEDWHEHVDDGEDDPEQASVSDVVERRGLGDTRFEVNSSKELCGGRTLFTFGGPNIWVHDNMVCGYWGSARVEMSFNEETRSAMFDWFKEYWEVVKA